MIDIIEIKTLLDPIFTASNSVVFGSLGAGYFAPQTLFGTNGIYNPVPAIQHRTF
jgi:hypothetical protein